MTIEDDRDTRTSNWTLATRTLPGQRDGQNRTAVGMLGRSEQELTP